jgi:hypothetical protein
MPGRGRCSRSSALAGQHLQTSVMASEPGPAHSVGARGHPEALTRHGMLRLLAPARVAPAIGLEPITCRLTEGLSWPGAPGAVSSVTLSCLHKGVPGLTRPC